AAPGWGVAARGRGREQVDDLIAAVMDEVARPAAMSRSQVVRGSDPALTPPGNANPRLGRVPAIGGDPSVDLGPLPFVGPRHAATVDVERSRAVLERVLRVGQRRGLADQQDRLIGGFQGCAVALPAFGFGGGGGGDVI